MRQRPLLVLALLCAVGASTATPAMAAGTSPAVPSAAPTPTDSFDEPVYLVKGYAPGGEQPRCDSRWRTAISAMHKRGWVGQLVRVGFYRWDTPDTGCDVNLGNTDGDPGTPPTGSRDTSIKELGRRLAWNIYNVYSSKGISIDLVGHSMGGLIIRAALAGYQLRESGWPGRLGEKLYVEDVVTLGTPHEGTKDIPSLGCGIAERTRQCKEMLPGRRGSGFLGWLRKAPNPQASAGTDWTLICSMADEVVQWRESACASTMRAHHVVVYPKRYSRRGEEVAALKHSDLRTAAKGKFWQFYWNYGDAYGYHFRSDGASPVKATQHSLYWATRW